MKAKKILLIIAATVLLTGCKKDESLFSGGSQPPTTQTTFNVYVHDLSVPSGMSLECLAIEYSNQNEPLETPRFNETSQQVINKRYIANSRSVKVKIAFNISGSSPSQSAHLWIQKVYYLNSGSNTQVEVTGSSPSGPYEP